jgi:hypothetical protein
VTGTTPAISSVKAKASTSNKNATISWKVTDIDGVESATLSIDGEVVSGVSQSGKSTARTYTYSSRLAAGSHTYTITAVDSTGLSVSSATYSFTVKATTPVISKVKTTVGTSSTATTIVWTVTDVDGIGSTTLAIDGTAVTGYTETVNGSATAYTYSGILAAGKHTYTISAADATGLPAKTVKGSFKVKVGAIAAVLAVADASGTTVSDWLVDL